MKEILYIPGYIFVTGIYNQAFSRDISANPLYEGCDFSKIESEPEEFAPSSFVTPNPIYGDMDDLPKHATKSEGKLLKEARLTI